MGLCICRDWLIKKRSSFSSERDLEDDYSTNGSRVRRDSNEGGDGSIINSTHHHHHHRRHHRRHTERTSDHVIDHLILDTPNMIRTYLEL